MYIMLGIFVAILGAFVFFYNAVGIWLGVSIRIVILIVIIFALIWQIYHVIFRHMQPKIKETNTLPKDLEPDLK